MRKFQQGFITLHEVIILVIWIAFVGGWIANIFKLVGMVSGDVTTMFILRIVGVFAAPLGAVFGYL